METETGGKLRMKDAWRKMGETKSKIKKKRETSKDRRKGKDLKL
jgi:hypothetical protein